VDYINNKPSISLTGIVPNALSDITTPSSGRGVDATDLLDLDARRRFAVFGKTFVDLERIRQSELNNKSKSRTTESFRKPSRDNRESLYESSCVTRQFVTMYNVSPAIFSSLTVTLVISHLVRVDFEP